MQKGKQACYQTNKQRKGVLEGQMWVWICVHRSTISEHRRYLCHQARFLKKDPGSHVQRRVWTYMRSWVGMTLDDTTRTQRHMHEHVNKNANKSKGNTQGSTKQVDTKGAKHVVTQG